MDIPNKVVFGTTIFSREDVLDLVFFLEVFVYKILNVVNT